MQTDGDNEIRRTGRALGSYLAEEGRALGTSAFGTYGFDAYRRARWAARHMERDGVLHVTDCNSLVEWLGWYDWRAVRVVPGLEETILRVLEAQGRAASTGA